MELTLLGAGIIQIENFGIHLHCDGTVVYGMKIESVMDRIRDGISLDHLSRLIVDVHQDSSRVTDSFISTYQLTLLDLVFRGDKGNRDKVNCIICDEIVPTMPAAKYMDRGPAENELRQCLGLTRFGHDITDKDVIIFGSHGLLLGGPNVRDYELTIYTYLSLSAREVSSLHRPPSTSS